jgi:multidrug efflux pump subunit AcrB
MSDANRRLAGILAADVVGYSAMVGAVGGGGLGDLGIRYGYQRFMPEMMLAVVVVLIALAAKNAILIVEFARQLEEQGKDTISAAVEACRLRLRPIIMTSLAFTLGVVPLYLAVGAGAEMRIALGTAVFWGMIGVTLFGLIFTPVFYAVIQRFRERGSTVS